MKFSLLLTMLISWALWLGGTIAVMVVGKHLFNVLPHEVAGQAANAMFHVFGWYELVLTGITILSAGFLLVTYPSKGSVIMVGIFVLAAGMVIAVTLGFMPAMDSLIDQGRQSSHEFIKLHIKSMIAMTIQAVLLLLSGVVILRTLGTGEPYVEAPYHEPEVKSEFEKVKGIPRGL